MKRIILSLTMGLLVSLLASENFENKHLKCTLTEKNGEQISERQAESLNEFKVDVLLSKTDLEVGYKTFKYKNTESGNDIYTDKENDYRVYIDYSKSLHIIYSHRNPRYLSYSNVEEIKGVNDFANYYDRKAVDELNNGIQEYFKEQSEYSCTEATFIEKAKYKYKNF